MFDFVPIDLYYPIYINLCFFLVLFTLFHTRVLDLNDPRNIAFIQISGFLILVFLILYIGQRPVSGRFGDTVNYAFTYDYYKYGGEIKEVGDYGWHVFMKFMANNTSIHTFFTVVGFIYIFPLFKISKTFFKEYWYYAFFMFVVSFSFWTYGVNGMRNGAACSLFLWGVSYHHKKVVMAILFLLATMFHKTLFLPILAFICTYIYNNPKNYFKGWLATIPFSLVLGSIFIGIFAGLGFADDRLSGYLTGQAEEGTFASTGFRWDFLFHSAFAVFAGWYFVIKRGFDDKLYHQLFNTYLICNGFWVLVIRANYSNRFAYLSWFMMAIVIIYPMLKQQFFKNQHFMIGKIMLVYFAFTYFMYYFYSG
ncbi:EpsG family protein [Costertonia aggregata]|uniref:EpsG family protein n=1 Tax=Costertonia aggregata TaxID=343403 RepID=A0A7H9ATA0_9FLAO|nr:EpsG family protein [Costertonia aggregata]QLG46698.1 EpsG family protein [Costertonia aggregata]